MEKTIEVGGVQYTAHPRTNLNNRIVKYFIPMIGVFYQGLADDLGVDASIVAAVLLEYANVSSLVTGGVALLKSTDAPEVLQSKCIAWLTDVNLVDLGDALVKLVNEVNPTNPDRALAPDPLPGNADPKVSSAAKPNRKRRAHTG